MQHHSTGFGLFLLPFVFNCSYAASDDEQLGQSLETAFQAATHKAPLLFVVNAKQSSLQPDKAKPYEYKLTLYNVNPQLTYFSNRPQRITGQLPLANFVTYWKTGSDNFVEVPPNASFQAVTKDQGEQVGYVFKLEHLVYNASEKTLTFAAQLVMPPAQPVPTPSHLSFTSLFIDFDWNSNTP